MTRTITIQIGNSDNKLSQNEWSHFFHFVKGAIDERVHQTHFEGTSDPVAPWQNAAWVVIPFEHKIEELKRELSLLCYSFKQDSIAWTEGETEFIPPYKD